MIKAFTTTHLILIIGLIYKTKIKKIDKNFSSNNNDIYIYTIIFS